MIHERGLHSEEGSLRPTPPFDFAKSLDFLGMFPPMQEDQTVSEVSLTKAIRVGGRTIVFQLKPTGTIKMPALRYTLFSDHPFSHGLTDVILDRISFFLSLNDDLKQLIRHERREDYLAHITKAFTEVDERFLRTGEYDKVEDWLKNIRGIGEFSSRLIMLRGLGRMDKLAVEKRLIAAAGRVYGRPMKEQRLHVIAEKYGRAKGYWAYYLRTAAGP